MKKKFKAPRGYYRETKPLGLPNLKIKAIEFWLKHESSPESDVRFYVFWDKHDELIRAWEFIGSIDKEGYSDNTLIRHISRPRTRKHKAIYQSIMSGIRHLDEIH